MRTGRPTSDKKDRIIKVRINADTENFLTAYAGRNNMTVSEIIRAAIDNFCQASKTR